MQPDLDNQLAAKLKQLRQQKGWTLETLADYSGVSRATLSRIEKAEVSPTTNVLAKLCSAYQMTLTQLMQLTENQQPALIRAAEQDVWRDEENGFVRKVVSPPGLDFRGEMIACELPPGCKIDYDTPTRMGLEHHLLMQSGELTLTVGNYTYHLQAGDCLRYRIFANSNFYVPGAQPAKYLLFML